MKIINLFAGPGAGKSTTAAGLFHFMKLAHMNVELVTEHARATSWERREPLPDQLSLFAQQHRRLSGLKGVVDYVVTDSPLLMSAVYRDEKLPPVFEQLVVELWSGFENCNFLLERTKPYLKLGRRQNEHEAHEVDLKVKAVLAQYAVPYTAIPGNAEAPHRILEKIRELHVRPGASSPKWAQSRGEAADVSGIEAALGAVAADSPEPIAPVVELHPEPVVEATKPPRKRKPRKKQG